MSAPDWKLIVDAVNEEYERLQSISEEELRGQTEKFRQRIREVTGELEAPVAELKEQKKITADAAEREQIDLELGGADGRGGVEGELREATAEVLDEILPEAYATVREAARRLVGTPVKVTSARGAITATVRRDEGVPRASAAVPFSAVGGSAGDLISDGDVVTDVRVERA